MLLPVMRCKRESFDLHGSQRHETGNNMTVQPVSPLMTGVKKIRDIASHSITTWKQEHARSQRKKIIKNKVFGGGTGMCVCVCVCVTTQDAGAPNPEKGSS